MEPFPLGPQHRAASADEPLDLLVTDTFRIKGRGTITAGQIRTGTLRQGQLVEIVRPDGESLRAKVRGIDFICGPNVRRDVVGFVLDPHPDDFAIEGAVIRSLTGD